MNRHLRWAFALALLPIAACSSNTPAPVAVAPAPPALAAVDQSFANAAAASDAAEIQASQLAQTKAHAPRVKQFATHMVADHTKTTQQLTTILQSKGVTATATPSDQATAAQTKLAAETGRQFDRDYMHGQVTAHIAAVKVFQDEISNGQDADLKAFAQATLPTIQQHLKMAQQISGFRG